MKRTLSSVFVLLFWCTATAASLPSGIDKLINQVDPAINIGVEVFDLTSNKSLYTRNHHRAFIPASNMKIFSDAAALMLLGPDYQFNNQLSTDGTRIQNAVLKGNLYLHLPGDPSFDHQQLKTLLTSLKDWNIKRIQGNVIIDSAHSAIHPYAPGWMIEDLAYSYGAPIAPLIIDTNRVTITVNPAAAAGKPAIVEISDKSASITLNNQVKTKARIKGCGVDFSMDNNNHLTLKGCIGRGQWAIQQRMAIRNPLNYTQALIKKQLAELAIQLDGEVALGKAPKGTLLMASSSSKPISQLMADTLKPSDNLYAESLFLHAAAKFKGVPVNWSEAQPLIKQFLQKQTGIDLKSAVLTDGSGLSRYDLLTPNQTVRLLQFLHERFHFSYEFISALPVSGRDGTLQRRFNKPAQQDVVRAKTGTMKGVISLSGYLYTANAHTLAFAIYINNLPGTQLSVSGRYRYLVDALCSYLLKQRPKTGVWARLFPQKIRPAFQSHRTHAQLQRKRQSKWRRLENNLKKTLKGQPISIIYRGKKLLLNDNQKDPKVVWAALQNLNKKYPFTVALASTLKPSLSAGKPMLLWIQTARQPQSSGRIWTIKETAYKE